MNRLTLGRSSVVLSIIGLLTIPVSFAQEPSAKNELANPGFEEIDINDPNLVVGWVSFGGSTRIGAPSGSAQEGIYALELTQIRTGWDVAFVRQRQLFDVVPGEEVYASAYMNIEESPPSIPYFEAFLKITFFEDDTFSVDITPASISKGRDNQGQDPFYFPGIEGLPMIVSGSSAGSWHLTQSQGVVPEGATLATVAVFNINFTGIPAPVWFDNVVFARLEPDDDADRIANEIDTDPLTPSVDFSDGTTSGTVIADANQILSINDEPGPDGVRITADLGSGSPARVRVCDALATLTIKPGNEAVITCGSVILEVEAGPAITMEIELAGETATVEVPADTTVTFEPDIDSLGVESTSPDTEPVILTVGDSIIPIISGEEIVLPSILIDIKPGSDPNCFNVDGNGVIPVAILGSESIDVGEVDQRSLRLGGLDVRVRGNGAKSCGTEDTNADGHPDLVCHFEDDPDRWNPGSASAELSGTLRDGTPISGIDSICIVP